jgi:hypothetical protein
VAVSSAASSSGSWAAVVVGGTRNTTTMCPPPVSSTRSRDQPLAVVSGAASAWACTVTWTSSARRAACVSTRSRAGATSDAQVTTASRACVARMRIS